MNDVANAYISKKRHDIPTLLYGMKQENVNTRIDHQSELIIYQQSGSFINLITGIKYRTDLNDAGEQHISRNKKSNYMCISIFQSNK